MAVKIFAHSHSRGGDIDDYADRSAFVGYVQGDTSYPTGGYSVDPTMFGMTLIDQVLGGAVGNTMLVGAPAAVTGLQTSNFKLKVIVPATGAEVVNGTNLSANNYPCFVIGE